MAVICASWLAAPPAARAKISGGFHYDIVGTSATVKGCFRECPSELVIPATLGAYAVTSIGDSAFYGDELISVTLPNSILTIGDGAFAYNSIESVVLSDSLVAIGSEAFYRNLLTEIELPTTVELIGSWAFGSNLLNFVEFPSAIANIGDGAFEDNELSRVTFLGNQPIGGEKVFAGNADFEYVSRTAGTTGWEETWGGSPVYTSYDYCEDTLCYQVFSAGHAIIVGCEFETCDYTDIVIPSQIDGYTVTAIDSLAFPYQGVTSINIPNSVTAIGEYAFYGNDLTSINISRFVTIIGAGAFSNNGLTALSIPSSLTTIGYQAFSFNAIRSLVLPNSVVTIADQAFYNNRIASLSLGASTKEIGSYAFASNDLTAVEIPNSVTYIGAGAFQGNGSIRSLALGNRVTVIGEGAFASNNLRTIVLPNSVATIGDQAFSYNLLTSATFLGNAPSAGNDVFASNSGLTSVTRSSTTTGWGSTWSGKAVVIADARAAATVKPTVTGTSTVGKTLTAVKGTWTGYPTPTFTYQWYACTRAVTIALTNVPSTCVGISGATKSTFKLTSTQRGKYVAVLVKGTSLRTTATTWLSKTTAKVK